MFYFNLSDNLNYANYKDSQLRLKYWNREVKIKLIKTLLIDLRISYQLKYLIKLKYLDQFGKLSLRIRNHCLLTGKTRFVFKFFNLNRSSLKYFLSFGFISGFRRW